MKKKYQVLSIEEMKKLKGARVDEYSISAPDNSSIFVSPDMDEFCGKVFEADFDCGPRFVMMKSYQKENKTGNWAIHPWMCKEVKENQIKIEIFFLNELFLTAFSPMDRKSFVETVKKAKRKKKGLEFKDKNRETIGLFSHDMLQKFSYKIYSL